MMPRSDEDNSNSTKECISISSGSMNDNTYAPSCTCIGSSSKMNRAMEMAEEMIPSHRYTHMLGEYMEDSISPSVPFLEFSSLNTYDDVILTELDSHANMVALGQIVVSRIQRNQVQESLGADMQSSLHLVQTISLCDFELWMPASLIGVLLMKQHISYISTMCYTSPLWITTLFHPLS